MLLPEAKEASQAPFPLVTMPKPLTRAKQTEDSVGEDSHPARAEAAGFLAAVRIQRDAEGLGRLQVRSGTAVPQPPGCSGCEEDDPLTPLRLPVIAFSFDFLGKQVALSVCPRPMANRTDTSVSLRYQLH